MIKAASDAAAAGLAVLREWLCVWLPSFLRAWLPAVLLPVLDYLEYVAQCIAESWVR